MGALEYFPPIDIGPESSEIVELDSLIDIAQFVLEQRAELSEVLSGSSADKALYTLFQVGTSAGGARPKAVVGINRTRTEIRSGQMDLPEGFEHYLLKFDGISEHSEAKQTFGDPQGFSRVEYAYYLMAKDVGINISHCELLMDGPGLISLPSDLTGVETEKCIISHCVRWTTPTTTCRDITATSQLFSLMRSLKLNRAQALELYRRMVFNIVARNHDDHTKNFGFIMNGHHGWELAPAFDITYSYKPGSKWLNSHQMSLNGKRDDFRRETCLFRREIQ